MIIDAHTHIGPFNKQVFKIDDLLASMKEAGIDHSVLISNNHRNLPEGISTNTLIEYTKKHQNISVVGEVHFPTWGPEQLETLKEQLLRHDICGIKLYPGYQNFYPYDEKLFDLYAFCEKEGKPIVVHTGLLNIDAKGSIKQPQPIHMDDVAQRFPHLKIVLAHMGYPWLIDCAAVVYRNKNVYCDFSAFFSEYAPISEIEIQSFMKDMDTFKSLAGNFTKCLFGTDFPIYSQKEYVKAAQRLILTDEERELVFSKNAISVYNLPF